MCTLSCLLCADPSGAGRQAALVAVSENVIKRVWSRNLRGERFSSGQVIAFSDFLLVCVRLQDDIILQVFYVFGSFQRPFKCVVCLY